MDTNLSQWSRDLNGCRYYKHVFFILFRQFYIQLKNGYRVL